MFIDLEKLCCNIHLFSWDLMKGDHDNLRKWLGRLCKGNGKSIVWSPGRPTTKLIKHEVEPSVRFFLSDAVVASRRKTTPVRRDIKQVMLSNGIRTSIQRKTDQRTLMEN